jgi:hypothetical protein
MRNSNDTIGNRTRDLSACSVVPQPTAPPRAPINNNNNNNNNNKREAEATEIQRLKMVIYRAKSYVPQRKREKISTNL